MMMTSWQGAVAARVQRGVDLLDAKLGAGPWPWWQLVDLDSFYMSEWDSCVLGQVAEWYDSAAWQGVGQRCGVFTFAEDRLGVKDSELWSYGFNTDPEQFDHLVSAEVNALEDVWREVIEGRQDP